MSEGKEIIEFITWGGISFGALIGGIIVAAINFFIRRFFAKKDEQEIRSFRRREFTLELHARFNSNEVMKARADAEQFLLNNIGKNCQDPDLREETSNAVWLVAREYEFLSIVLEEEIVDKNLVAKYFFEIFIYWDQHFEYWFNGENFEIISRLKFLNDFFIENNFTSNRHAEMKVRQQKHINKLLEMRNKTTYFEFDE